MSLLEGFQFIAAMLLLLIAARHRNKNRISHETEEFDEEQEQADNLKDYLQAAYDEEKESLALNQSSKQVFHSPTQKQSKKPFQNSKNMGYEEELSLHQAHLGGQNHYATTKEDPYAMRNKDPYGIVKKQNSRGYLLVQHLKNPQDMVLFREIMGPPLSLKSQEPYGNFPR